MAIRLKQAIEVLRAERDRFGADVALTRVKSWPQLFEEIFKATLPVGFLVIGITLVGNSRCRGRKDLLLRVVTSQDMPMDARKAALSFFTCRDARSEQVIVSHLNRNREDEIGLSLVFALRWIGSRNACEAVIALASHPNPAVRAAAAEVMGDLGCWIPIRVMSRLLRDSDPNVRAFGIRSMSLLRMPGFRSKLNQIAKSDLETDSFGDSVSSLASKALVAEER